MKLPIENENLNIDQIFLKNWSVCVFARSVEARSVV